MLRRTFLFTADVHYGWVMSGDDPHAAAPMRVQA